MIGTSQTLGNYLVDGEGNSLYYFTKDSSGASACNGDCIKNWPAFTASSFVLPSALNPADFGTITRSDGASQVTYKGYPLYYWKKDSMRGEVTGQGVGKVWYIVDPEKFMSGKARRSPIPYCESSPDEVWPRERVKNLQTRTADVTRARDSVERLDTIFIILICT